jgi:integrase
MKTRTLANGRPVTVHRNNGLCKRCECARRAWATCAHPWHFSFKWKDVHHRFSVDRYAEGPIADRDAARTEADRLRILIRGGQFPPVVVVPAAPVQPADLTFETFAAKWQTNARSQQSPNQQLNDQGIVNRLAALKLGEVTLGLKSIGLFTVDDWETAFRQLDTLSASTRNKYRQAVLSMQDWAIDKGYLLRPWLVGKVLKKGGAIARRKGARRDRRLVPDVLDKQGRVTSEGEERRLLKHASPWLQRLIMCALDTGMRRGELLSLQWRDVDLPRARFMVRAEKSKTETARSITLSPRVAAVAKLLEHDSAGQPHKATAFVFGNAVGEQVKDPKKSWLACCGAAGIAGLHFHDLRHEAGSRMLEKGWPLHHIQQMLGHEDTKTTSIYLNATITELEDSMRRFPLGGLSLHDVAQSTESEPPLNVQQHDAPRAKALVN